MKQQKYSGPPRRKSPKTKAWTKARNRLKADGFKNGRTFCEFQFPGCWGSVDGYSHPETRQHTKDLEYLVVAACNFCHQIAERHKDKLALHEAVVASRDDRYYSAA